MIKLVLVIVAMLAILAADVSARPGQLSSPQGSNYKPEGTGVLFSSAVYGAGATMDLGSTADKFTVTVTWDGPLSTTSVTVLLQGSIDGINWATLVTYTSSTAAGETFHVVNKPVRYIRGYYSSKTGGALNDTTVSMKCTAGGM